MDAISDGAFFRTVVEAGGLGAGARVLNSSAPAASRRLAAIERRLGVRLAERSARRFRLTDEGRLYYERSGELLSALRDMEAEVSSRGTVARGLLRVAAPMDLGRRRIAPALAGFSRAHPELSIQLTLSDAGAELGEDLLDVAIRTGLPDDGNVVARRLASAPMLLCAAPAYVETHGRPATLADLGHHRCLLLARRHRRVSHWRHRDEAGGMAEVAVGGTLSSTSGDVLRQWALAAEGLSLEAAWDVAEDIREGRLVELLPGIAWQELALYATFLPGRPVPARVRLFVDWLAQLVSEPFGTSCGTGAGVLSRDCSRSLATTSPVRRERKGPPRG